MQYVILKDHRIDINIIMHFRKILEREDELFIVGNILKSLEVSEEKVKIAFYRLFYSFYISKIKEIKETIYCRLIKEWKSLKRNWRN